MVKKQGTHAWVKISEVLKTRTPRQCREHWRHYLNKNINREVWSEEEDQLLKKLYSEYGPRWSILATFFNNRTEINVKNRWSKFERQARKNRCVFYPTNPLYIYVPIPLYVSENVEEQTTSSVQSESANDSESDDEIKFAQCKPNDEIPNTTMILRNVPNSRRKFPDLNLDLT